MTCNKLLTIAMAAAHLFLPFVGEKRLKIIKQLSDYILVDRTFCLKQNVTRTDIIHNLCRACIKARIYFIPITSQCYYDRMEPKAKPRSRLELRALARGLVFGGLCIEGTTMMVLMPEFTKMLSDLELGITNHRTYKAILRTFDRTPLFTSPEWCTTCQSIEDPHECDPTPNEPSDFTIKIEQI